MCSKHNVIVGIPLLIFQARETNLNFDDIHTYVWMYGWETLLVTTTDNLRRKVFGEQLLITYFKKSSQKWLTVAIWLTWTIMDV